MKVCLLCNAILVKADSSNLDAARRVANEIGPITNRDEPAAGETTSAGGLSFENEVSIERGAAAGSWSCPNCRQPVPGTFEICWNCGASKDGTLDPDFDKKAVDESATASAESGRSESVANSKQNFQRCPLCGSTRMMTDLSVMCPAEGYNNCGVVVFGNPTALIFKERMFARFHADICGDCGHAELRVEGVGKLYEQYVKSQRADG